MAKQSETSVPILEGKALLVRIPKSPAWHVKYKAGGKWLRTSTKQSDLAEAKAAAADIVVEARVRERAGIPLVSQSFKSVANAAIKRMDRELADGHGKVVYETYKYVLRRYHIPYFASTYISKIDYPALNRFDEWRTTEAGKQLSKSAITNHNSAMNRVFDEAVLLSYMTRGQVPELSNNGTKGDRRPDFNIGDYRKLHRGMRKWVTEKTRKEQSSQIRYLLRDMVLILSNTGIRVGTECDNLKWKHIKLHKENSGKEYLTIHVNGKTKGRDLIARQRCKGWLARIHSRAEDLREYETLEELLGARVDKHVFRLADGTIPQRLDQAFTRLLTDLDLLTCPNTGKPRTMYSCRHTYATFALQRGIPIHTVAKQMGTSVAMLEKHYSHLTAFHARDQLSGIK